MKKCIYLLFLTGMLCFFHEIIAMEELNPRNKVIAQITKCADSYADLIKNMCFYFASLKVREKYFKITSVKIIDNNIKSIEMSELPHSFFMRFLVKKFNIRCNIENEKYSIDLDTLRISDIKQLCQEVQEKENDKEPQDEYCKTLIKLRVYVHFFHALIQKYKDKYNDSVEEFTHAFINCYRCIKRNNNKKSGRVIIDSLLTNKPALMNIYLVIEDIVADYPLKGKMVSVSRLRDLLYDDVDERLIKQSSTIIYEKSLWGKVINKFLNNTLHRVLEEDLDRECHRELVLFEEKKPCIEKGI